MRLIKIWNGSYHMRTLRNFGKNHVIIVVKVSRQSELIELIIPEDMC